MTQRRTTTSTSRSRPSQPHEPTSNTFVVLTKTIAVNALTQFEDKSSAGLPRSIWRPLCPTTGSQSAPTRTTRAISSPHGSAHDRFRNRAQGPSMPAPPSQLTIIGVTVQTSPDPVPRRCGKCCEPIRFFSAVSAAIALDRKGTGHCRFRVGNNRRNARRSRVRGLIEGWATGLRFPLTLVSRIPQQQGV
jgi:hypothetical protein